MSARRWVLYALVILAGWHLSVTADVIQCYPVSGEDQALYDEWGGQQNPPLAWESCAHECDRGLRLCRFYERPPSARDAPVMATCNGRDVGPPCKLVPR